MAKTNKSKGLGDTIKVITNALGFVTCDECEKRRELFNKWFPYANYKRGLTEEEVQFIKDCATKKMFQSEEVDRLFKMYNDFFQPKSRLEKCNCPNVIRTIIEQFNKVV